MLAVNKCCTVHFNLSTVNTIWPYVREKEKLKEESILKENNVGFFLTQKAEKTGQSKAYLLCTCIVLTLEMNIPP